MRLDFRKKHGYIALFTIAIGIGIFLTISHIYSYQTVQFSFDDKLGDVTVTGQNTTEKVRNNTPIRLKKGTYVIKKSGKNITHESQSIYIGSNTKDIPVTLNYSYEYLQQIYQNEKENITKTLYRAYPKTKGLYTLSGDRLYHQGELFGAALVFHTATDDNADTLHVVMKKQGNTWKVLSNPPEPILSKQNYPSIPREILRAINQAK